MATDVVDEPAIEAPPDPASSNPVTGQKVKRRGRPRGPSKTAAAKFTEFQTVHGNTIRHATYTSNEELELQEGIPGVYFNPSGYEKTEKKGRDGNPICIRGRPPKPFLAIFKSERLRDLAWFVLPPQSNGPVPREARDANSPAEEQVTIQQPPVQTRRVWDYRQTFSCVDQSS